MEGLLTPVSTSYKSSAQQEEDPLVEVRKPKKATPKTSSKASSPQEALEILKNEPDHEGLVSTLRYLNKDSSEFSIALPSPLAAQLVHVLVSDIVPNYWSAFYDGKKSTKKGTTAKKSSDVELLLSCLRSITGLNALLLSLKQLIQHSRETKKVVGGPNIHEVLTILLQVLAEVLQRDETLQQISSSIWNTATPPLKQKALWHEFLSIVGSGKILGLAAEAEDVAGELSNNVGERHWIADGSAYSSWLARNVTHYVKFLPTDSGNGFQHCGDVLGKAFRLGYAENVTKELVVSLLFQQEDRSRSLERLLSTLPPFEQRNFIYSLLSLISKDYLSSTVTSEDHARWWQADASTVSAAAGLIKLVLGSDESRKDPLIAWLTSPSGAGLGSGIAIRRAVIAALAVDKNDAETILDKSLRQFGDQLYIRHTPTMQQEVHAQILLLSAGYIHRMAPLRLAIMMRSGTHLSVVSNRLAASSPRARFLGMVVGEALSSLVDKGDKRMDFKMEEMSAPDAKWYKSLVTVSDSAGSLEPLKQGTVIRVSRKKKNTTSQPPPKPKASQPSGSKIISIEEVSDSEEEDSGNDGLTPYAKPDSDEEDSDEDPNLITRNKPPSPVYIRDLIIYLRDTENYDKQKLALQTAAPLIRRKANFGTEVSAHAEELATLLVGLQDKYKIEDFADMRLHGMIAVLIALPLKMGQWFAKTFFDGDYSLSQRASILTTLGLGARELGGFGSEDSIPTATSKKTISSSFPSKSLPPALHKVYAPSNDTALDTVSSQLSNTMIAPMAASLADKLTGPSILKIRTFSSRMAVEAKRKKPIANALAKVVADGFFFPLTGRFFIHLRAYGASSNQNIVFQPHLLSLFIKTLALLLHASGPSTLSLPQMTSEFWDLLLSLRTQSIGEVVVVESMCFAFLMVLEVNEDKRTLVERHGRQLLETQEWVEGVFGRLGIASSEEDEGVKMMAAGCLVRIREVVEKYQALLIGDLVSF